MYGLVVRIPHGLDPLKDIFEKHVLAVGTRAVHENATNALDDPRLYVETILKVHAKYNDLVAKAFKNDSGFVASLDKACRRFINENTVTKLAKTCASPLICERGESFRPNRSTQLTSNRSVLA